LLVWFGGVASGRVAAVSTNVNATGDSESRALAHRGVESILVGGGGQSQHGCTTGWVLFIPFCILGDCGWCFLGTT
jgi:hypothetical protein